MVRYIAGTVIAGIAIGRFLLPDAWAGAMDSIVTYALAFMVFVVGIDIGRNRAAMLKIRTLGWRVLIVPFSVASGSLLGACLARAVFEMPLKEILAVGAGLGWYSLSGVLIAQLYSVQLGATAFLANVFREMMAFFLIPLLVGYVGKIVSIAPGGATTMDSTLPLVTKVTDTETGLIAFTSGVVLTAAVPLLIPFFLGL